MLGPGPHTRLPLAAGHVDMVCEKDGHVQHDFFKDPLKLVRRGCGQPRQLPAVHDAGGVMNGAPLLLLTSRQLSVYMAGFLALCLPLGGLSVESSNWECSFAITHRFPVYVKLVSWLLQVRDGDWIKADGTTLGSDNGEAGG